MNVLSLAEKRVKLIRLSNTHSGEYHGPCPACGGEDRFRVNPEYKKNGYYNCRQCGKHGDNIQFLRDFEGMS